MDKLVFPQSVTFSNAEEWVKKLSQEIAPLPSAEFDLDHVIMNTINKAVLRSLYEMYPDKLVIPPKILSSILLAETEQKEEKASPPKKDSLLVRLGEMLIGIARSSLFLFVIFVDMLFYAIQSLWNKRDIIKGDTAKNAYYIGYKAIPIIFLLSFLIGFTISIQSAIQMAKLGGQGYLSMLITYGMFKELGPLVTAIIIAGRTGSSIAAEIGTMVVMEEVDALTTMGVKPLKFLLVPKFWAFTLAMPVLTLLADCSGVLGGLVVGISYNIPAASFVSESMNTLKLMDIFWGTVKSFTFAWVILAIACFKGLNVRGGADAVGRATTESVVLSIFMVIIIDAIYSLILYTQEP